MAPPISKRTRTFRYTGREQSFKVPKGVSQLILTINGASGGGGGKGGSIEATIPVKSRQSMEVYVGGQGGRFAGFNGGGVGGGFEIAATVWAEAARRTSAWAAPR